MIAWWPPAWEAKLPKARNIGPRELTPVAYVPVEPSTLRQKLLDTAKGKHGDGWSAWRRAALGERLFRIEGGPGDSSLPLVIGVDEFLSKRMLWTLAAAGDDWHRVPPAELATLLAPSLSILRADVQSIGGASKWFAEHVEEKWIRASEKVATEREEADALTSRLVECLERGASEKDTELPPVLQLDDRYFLLDDRNRAKPSYEGPHKGVAVYSLGSELWGDRRMLITPTKNGSRAATVSEIMQAYGKAITTLAIDYSAEHPRVEDLTFFRPPQRLPAPPATYDPEVEAWLAALDPSGSIIPWIVHAAYPRARSTAPALALVGASEVGKTLLACGLALAAGQKDPGELGSALGRFNSVLSSGHILFADEGLPRAANGMPQTQEFRGLLTRTMHALEFKGIDKRVYVHGGVRVVLAANRSDSLFSNKGNLNADDISALLRRLLVVDIAEGEQATRARTLAVALGGEPGDPKRLARVAGHIRWIQETCAHLPAPQPRAGTIRADLRKGNDLTKAMLDALEDSVPCDWIAVDESRNTLWVQTAPWAMRSGVMGGAGPAGRAIASYVRVPSRSLRRHPITDEEDPRRARWTGLNLQALEEDNVKVRA